MTTVSSLPFRFRFGLQISLVLLSFLFIWLLMSWGSASLISGMEHGGGLALYVGVTFATIGLQKDADPPLAFWAVRGGVMGWGIWWDCKDTHAFLPRLHGGASWLGWGLMWAIPLLLLSVLRLGLLCFRASPPPSSPQPSQCS